MTPEKRLTQIPKLFKGLYQRAIKGRSQAAAIRSQCLECCGYVLNEVTNCTDTGCPLFMYRHTGRKIPPPAHQQHDTTPETFKPQNWAKP